MLKKQSVLLSILMIFVLLLAACSSAGNTEDDSLAVTSAPDTGLPSNDATQSLPDTGAGLETLSPTEEVSPTGDAGATAEMTEAPTTASLATEAPTTEAAETESPAATETQASTASGAGEASAGTATPSAGATETMTGTETLRGAEVLPQTGRDNATLLSSLIGYKVMDASGNTWGTVSDYIVNVCEAHIIYMVVDADASLNLENGGRLLVPYEVVTLQEGKIDIDQKAITVNLDNVDLSGAPAFDEELDLSNLDWESDVQAFWSEHGPLTITTECTVAAPNTTGDSQEATPEATEGAATPTGEVSGGTDQQGGAVTVHKVAYASELLSAELQTGNGDPLGTVEEVIVEPESGQLQYVVVSLDGVEGVVPVPFRALNIPDGDGQSPLVLILLVDQEILDNAPSFNAIDSSNRDWRDPAFEYWRQHVPLEERAQP